MAKKVMRVQSVVYPENNLSFNEWAQQLNVSCLYDEPQRGGHYYPPIEIKKSFFKKVLIMFGITN